MSIGEDAKNSSKEEIKVILSINFYPRLVGFFQSYSEFILGVTNNTTGIAKLFIRKNLLIASVLREATTHLATLLAAASKSRNIGH